jgi:hypothetical protein
MKNRVNNTSGFVTAEFVFSFMLASFMTALLFALCLSFTIIEISQYISFSATRAAIPSRKNFAEQRQRAQDVYQRLVANPVIAPLLNNGWFTLALRDVRMNQDPNDDFRNEYDPRNSGVVLMPAAGVRLTLTANILNLNLGPLGNIESETENGFSLTIATLLFREPNMEECQNIIRTRYQRILNLDSTLYPTLGSAGLNGNGAYYPMEDNGC